MTNLFNIAVYYLLVLLLLHSGCSLTLSFDLILRRINLWERSLEKLRDLELLPEKRRRRTGWVAGEEEGRKVKSRKSFIIWQFYV